MNEENLVQKCSHTTQISWFSCWSILIRLSLYSRPVEKKNFLKGTPPRGPKKGPLLIQLGVTGSAVHWSSGKAPSTNAFLCISSSKSHLVVTFWLFLCNTFLVNLADGQCAVKNTVYRDNNNNNNNNNCHMRSIKSPMWLRWFGRENIYVDATIPSE